MFFTQNESTLQPPQISATELSIPIATMVGSKLSNYDESLKEQYSIICNSIKHLKETFLDFCENEEEFHSIIKSIEKDPYSYTTGKPIFKKYSLALIEREKIESQMNEEEELKKDINLTPQELKKDMKNYVFICEKKIAKQQEQCDALEKQVEQLMDVFKKYLYLY